QRRRAAGEVGGAGSRRLEAAALSSETRCCGHRRGFRSDNSVLELLRDPLLHLLPELGLRLLAQACDVIAVRYLCADLALRRQFAAVRRRGRAVRVRHALARYGAAVGDVNPMSGGGAGHIETSAAGTGLR